MANARDKLNVAAVRAALLLAIGSAVLTGSWVVGTAILAASIALRFYSGDIRVRRRQT